jgi:hypothetical protein
MNASTSPLQRVSQPPAREARVGGPVSKLVALTGKVRAALGRRVRLAPPTCPRAQDESETVMNSPCL